MRDVYMDTISLVEADGTIKALSNVEITVYLAGTTSLATIYQRRDPANNAQGPSPETGASGGPNPFTTGVLGAVEFWCVAGVYDIHVRDLNAIERIARRGAGGAAAPVAWNSSPMSAGAVPTSILSEDGGLGLAHVGSALQRQEVQIGQVIDWWRPSSAVPIPTGFEIVDGRQIAAGQHNFPGVAGAVNLPDLRNKFIIGADPNKADGTVSSPGDGTAVSGAQHPNAPGIGGNGGSNAVHLHTVPAHYHSARAAGADISVSGGSHGHNIHTADMHSPDSSNWTNLVLQGWDPGKQFDSGQGTDAQAHAHANGEFSGRVGLVTGGSNGDGGFNAGTTDGRPAHVGLLKLMKVRRA